MCMSSFAFGACRSKFCLTALVRGCKLAETDWVILDVLQLIKIHVVTSRSSGFLERVGNLAVVLNLALDPHWHFEII